MKKLLRWIVFYPVGFFVVPMVQFLYWLSSDGGEDMPTWSDYRKALNL